MEVKVVVHAHLLPGVFLVTHVDNVEVKVTVHAYLLPGVFLVTHVDNVEVKVPKYCQVCSYIPS